MKDERSTNYIDVAIRYGNGKATDDELEDAAFAAARAATATAYAAFAAAFAANAAAFAAYAAADAANARKETLAKCADICREVLTEDVLKPEEI